MVLINEGTFWWKHIIAAITSIILLLATGGTVVNWMLSHVSARLDDRLKMYNMQIDDIYRRLERIENR